MREQRRPEHTRSSEGFHWEFATFLTGLGKYAAL